VKEFHKPFRVLVQDPQIAVSNKERISTIKAIYDIATDMGQERWNSPDIKFQFYDDHASIRAAIFRDENNVAVLAILGWYVYRDHNTALSGSRHPSIFVTKSSKQLLQFVDEQFTRRWVNENSISYNKIEEMNSQMEQLDAHWPRG
jgi:hypothetical protein